VDLPGMARLGALLPPSVVRVAESGIKTRGDVETLSVAGYGAFLVGETLLRAVDPARALRELRGENATEIKICGITREEDVDTCMDLGVDWIGLIFAARSPRRVTPERGISLKERARAAKGVVAVFAENSEAEIQDVLERVRPDVIQMPLSSLNHSKKPFSSDIPLWNTIRVGRDDLSTVSERKGAALHFDTSVTSLSGGTGKTFDWSLLAAVDRTRPVILAGGLKPGNVADAVRSVKPDVVDVASGVESAPGIKDRARIAAFVREVRGV
jgi:phosphoribosylanthranilate isomerase